MKLKAEILFKMYTFYFIKINICIAEQNTNQLKYHEQNVLRNLWEHICKYVADKVLIYFICEQLFLVSEEEKLLQEYSGQRM